MMKLYTLFVCLFMTCTTCLHTRSIFIARRSEDDLIQYGLHRRGSGTSPPKASTPPRATGGNASGRAASPKTSGENIGSKRQRSGSLDPDSNKRLHTSSSTGTQRPASPGRFRSATPALSDTSVSSGDNRDRRIVKLKAKAPAHLQTTGGGNPQSKKSMPGDRPQTLEASGSDHIKGSARYDGLWIPGVTPDATKLGAKGLTKGDIANARVAAPPGGWGKITSTGALGDRVVDIPGGQTKEDWNIGRVNGRSARVKAKVSQGGSIEMSSEDYPDLFG